MSFGALSEPLVCSYDKSHSRTWHVSITSLAATGVSQMVTHPSTNQAQGCLTSVFGLWMVTPCQPFLLNLLLKQELKMSGLEM